MFYLETTDKSIIISLQTLRINIVINHLKKIDDKKATSLDNIASKLLKMAAGIMTPALTAIFSKSILTAIYPNEWKTVPPPPQKK